MRPGIAISFNNLPGGDRSIGISKMAVEAAIGKKSHERQNNGEDQR
jgi:hypothetical protein